jgi:hypothetical protein
MAVVAQLRLALGGLRHLLVLFVGEVFLRGCGTRLAPPHSLEIRDHIRMA